MSGSDWRRVAEVAEAALDLPAAEVEAFLRDACGDDTSLLREVRSVLTIDASDSGRLDAPAGPSLVDVVEPASDPRLAPGARLGRYRIVDVIASGGMGTVYRGERADDEYRKTVAIKVIKRGMDTDALLAAFRAERQAMAQLEHPNIARLMDGGAVDDGRPYLVMEFIEGMPIDAYCAAKELGVRARLDLFLAVCDAVEHAHRNLVIHRDLKPGNVFVTPDGQVKLLDFGLAKLLDADPGGATAVTGARIMTPRYASPEQVAGAPISTATDVYALGVILYELLTDRSPYASDTDSWDAMRRTILEQEPSRPSSAVVRAGAASASRVARQRSRRLSGDLDTIVLAALRKEPERRYASVARLSEDIRRHLADLPIRTRPDTLGYLARKFVQRNRVAVAATVAIMLILGAALAVTSSLLARTVTAQREAEYQASLAHVHAAEAAVRLADLATARADLERTPESMRGWVWRHLHQRCDRSVDAWPIDPDGPPAAWHIRAASGDGSRIAVATVDGRLRLLDPAARQSLLEIEHEAYPRAACFSPGGRVLAIGTGSWVAGRSGPFEIRFFDTTTGDSVGPPCVGHDDAVQGLAYSPDGTLIASAGSDRTVRVWDAATRRELRQFDDHGDEAHDVAFAPGGEELASVGWDGRVVRRSLDDGSTLAVLDASGVRLTTVAYDDTGDLIAAGAVDGHVYVFDRRSGQLRARLRGSTDVREVRGFFVPGSSRLWTWGNDGVMQLWDLDRSEPLVRVLGLGDSVAMLLDASLVTAGSDGLLRRWSDASANVPTWREDGWVYGARLGPGAAWVATTVGAEVHIRIPGSGESLRTLRHGGGVVRDVDTTADGAKLLSCGDGVVDVWDAATGSRVAQMAGDRARFHPRGATLASLGDNELRVHDSATGEIIGEPVTLPDRPNHLQLLRDGREVVVTHRDGSLTFCDLERRTVVERDETTHAQVVEAFALAPGGRGFVTGARDGRLVWWDVATREPVFEFDALPEWTSAVAFSPDGAIMATGGSAGTIRIWDVAERREVGLLRGHLLRVLSLEFSADGTTLVSSSSDGTVRFWTSGNPVTCTAPTRLARRAGR